MTAALREVCPDATVWLYKNKHLPASKAIGHLGDMEKCFTFTVMRSPWDIIGSYWRHAKNNPVLKFDSCPPGVGHWWYFHCRHIAQQTFDQFVSEFYLSDRFVRDGGFWKTYCCDRDGQDLGVKVYQFSDLDTAWTNVCQQLGAASPPEFPNLNSADFPSGEWTQPLVDAVREKYHMDVEKFGYEPPAVQ